MSLVGLRAFREVVEKGTVTAAAAALGYTQSAVSRQLAALERAVGAPLLERRHDGVRPTAAGRVVLRSAALALDQLDAAARELAASPPDAGPVRLGWYPSAGAVLVPRALTALRRDHPAIAVNTREGSSAALVRALRAGTIDLAVLASAPPFRPFDTESPPLRRRTLTERSLCVAVPAGHPLAAGDAVRVADLRGHAWIAGPKAAGEDPMGVWPGLDERPRIAHVARDWLAKLHLVAAGAGITTVPGSLAPLAPPGVRVLPVEGGPDERRRVVLAWARSPLPAAVARVAEAVEAAAGS